MSVIGATTGIGVDTSRIGNDKNLKAAGERFEAVFTGMMLKSMRQAKLADGLFENKAGTQFRDMWDQKLAENMAVTTPMGIGKAMTEFLAKAQKVNAAETANSTQAGPQAAVNPSEGKSG